MVKEVTFVANENVKSTRWFLDLLAELFANGCCIVADRVDRFSEVFLGYAESSRPVLEFVWLMQVDLRPVRLLGLG